MENPNKHINEFLDYYYKYDGEPGYAVLINGRWGTGKTWFIAKDKKAHEEEGKKFLYVSLYGLTSFEQIEDEIFKQLHPLLSSKSMAITGKVLKGLLKTTLKIDIDGDNKGDLTVGSSIPDIDLPGYLKDTESYILIFDDLERASIDLVSLLGYINYFVEHQGHKVVIIANEEELLHEISGSDTQPVYRRIKEKLIGKSFTIQAELHVAIKYFIANIEDDKFKELYSRGFDDIVLLYNDSGAGNLRSLNHSLHDFERFVCLFDDGHIDNYDLMIHLLKIFLILSFEVRSGNINVSDILDIKSESIKSYGRLDSGDVENNSLTRMFRKYKGIDFYNLLIEGEDWYFLFDNGTCNEKKIRLALSNSKYMRDESTPDWVRLWDLLSISASDFKRCLQSVEEDFHSLNFEDENVVRHVTGIFLKFSSLGFIDESRDAVLSIACKCVDKIKHEGKLNACPNNIYDPRADESWGGLGFIDKDSDEFKALTKHINSCREDVIGELLPVKANELIDAVSEDPDKFYKSLVMGNSSDDVYVDIPVFEYAQAESFVDKFISADENAKSIVRMAFDVRYRGGASREVLKSELGFLERSIELIEKHMEESDCKLSKYQLSKYLEFVFYPAASFIRG